MPAVFARRSALRRDPHRLETRGLDSRRWGSRLKALLRALLLLAWPVARAEPVQEIVVVASQFREADVAAVPASLTVLGADSIATGSVQHFEELIPQVPNLNWSGEGSRARYFQVRGTGELEQYQGAPNPSVGFLVDDIDLSGIGGVATSFDVGQIEVLRGPQGTRYGANALAGLVYVETAQPTAVPEAEFSVTGGDDGTWALGGVASGPVADFGEALTWRLAVQQYQADGFRHNAFLGRDDTSGQDEFTARAKLRWQPAAGTTVQLTAMHVNLDDGYDDFAIDNGYTTYSDKPGEDSQRTDAAALRATVGLGAVADLTSISTLASSRSVYAFDADWGNDAYWAPDTYDFTTRIDRDRDTLTQEFRAVSRPGSELLGADWVAGLYVLDLREDVEQRDTARCPASTCGVDFFYDTSDAPAASHYEATSLAAYGELGWDLAGGTRLAAGLRREVRDADYRDSAGNHLDPVDRLWGGDLTLTHRLAAYTAADTTLWARAARGYKAGGFNPSVLAFPADDRLQFGPETLWNYEVGARAAGTDGGWWTSVSLFFQQRDDQQVKIPEQLVEGDPNTFLFFTENAEEGSIRGLELEGRWRPPLPGLDGRLTLGAALGLLDTEIGRFTSRPELEGREQAHAPRYTFAVNGEWRTAGGWFARVDVAGRDGFAIDYCQVDACAAPDPETDAYQVLDLRAGREWGAWSVEAWCRNLLDEQYAVRGFYFGNEPPDFTPALYTRLGDPRHAGLTVKYRL
ncbi:MAG: TonB-dependent receptor [Chromatiales bacterium]|nr:TonB-dependent receptor [Chromatiales bacterium]